MSVYTHFIGIDIGKFEVVSGVHGRQTTLAFPNTQEGLQIFLAAYADVLKGALVVLETTGGYEKLFLKGLLEKAICVHRANTRQVKSFIRSLGRYGKTDALDALSLARYGHERQDRLCVFQPPENSLEVLSNLAMRRIDLNKLLVAEKNRLQAPESSEFVKKSCKAVIQLIKSQLQELQEEMEKLIQQNPQLYEKQAILKTVPGIGDITSLMLVVLLPELGHLNRRQIASLAGLAPHPNESGTKVGYRRTKGGRKNVKNILFMAGMAAAHSKSKLADIYASMLARGKNKMVALTALMRKIIVIANARVKELVEKQGEIQNS